MILLSLLLGVLFPTTGWSFIITISPPNSSPDFTNARNIFHLEAEFCSAPPRLTNAIIAKVVKADPFDACEPLTNIDEVNNSIVLVTRGSRGCSFVTKVNNIQKADGLAEVLIDSVNNTAPPKQQSASSTMPAIPLVCLGLRYDDAQIITDALDNNQVVWGKLYQELLQPTDNEVLDAFLDRTSSTSWDRSIDPCTTTLPTPPTRGGWTGMQCDEDGYVNYLKIDFPMNGVIPGVLGNLTKMKYFDVQDDRSIVGKMPDELWQWKNVTNVIISGTHLDSLSYIAYSNWTELLALDLSDNMLSDLPPFLGAKLQTLDLSNNYIEGAFHSDYFPNGGSLREANFADNYLGGTVPDFSHLPAINSMHLEMNFFTNLSEPTQICNLTKLSIGNNSITVIPNGYFTFTPNLTYLDMSNNDLTSVPWLPPKLQSLDISDNWLGGDFPIVPSGVTYLGASKNEWTSAESINRTTLPSLEELDLSEANLTGEFLETVVIFPTTIRKLVLFKNQLSGRLDVARFPNLYHVDLSHNLLSGSLDRSDFETALLHCDLSFNNFTGIIPNDLRDINFEILSLNGNPGLNCGKSSLIPTFLTYTFDRPIPFPDLGLECPSYYLYEDSDAEVLIDPSYHNYTLCRCLPTYYYFPNTTRTSCKPCLEHAQCPGGGDPENYNPNTNIIADKGYYPTPTVENPEAMVPCRFRSFLPESAANPCNDNSSGSIVNASFGCADGYEGYLCSSCKAGFFSKQGYCVDCQGRWQILSFLIIPLCLGFVFYYFIFWRTGVKRYPHTQEPTNKEWSFRVRDTSLSSTLIEVYPMVVDYFQTSILVLTRINRAKIIIETNSMIGIPAIVTPTFGLGLECDLINLRDYPRRALFTLLLPIFFFTAFSFVFLLKVLYLKYFPSPPCVRCFLCSCSCSCFNSKPNPAAEPLARRNSYQETAENEHSNEDKHSDNNMSQCEIDYEEILGDWEEVKVVNYHSQPRCTNSQLLVYGVLNLCYLMYLPLSEYVISFFRCSEDPWKSPSYWFIQDEPNVACNDVTAGVKWTFLLLYPVGLGLLFLCFALKLSLLSKKKAIEEFSGFKELEKDVWVQNLGFFYLPYKPSRVYASVFFVGRKFALSLVIGLASASKDSFPVLVLFVLGTDFAFCLLQRPYLTEIWNVLRMASILVTIILFFNGIVYASSTQFPQGTGAPVAAHFVLNVLMMIIFIYSIWKAMEKAEEEEKENKEPYKLSDVTEEKKDD